MYKTVIEVIDRLLREKEIVTVAIDGRCASGKTTLADMLAKHYDANLFHMDDFFLRPSQRTPERFAEAGGNVDRERFLEEVLLPLEKGEPFIYRPYDCATQALGDAVSIQPKRLNVIEGSYSCHPLLFAHYDLHVFLTVDADTQMCRICKRNGEEKAKIFRKRWIPLEEAYFAAFAVADRCEIQIHTK